MLMRTPTYQNAAQEVSAFSPEKLTQRGAERSRRLAIPRGPAPMAPGWSFMFLPAPDADAWAETGPMVEIDVRIDGETAHIRTVRAAIDTLVHQAEPRIAAGDMDVQLLAALLETHALEQIEALEAMLRTTFTIERLQAVRDHQNLAHLDINLTVNGSLEPYPAKIFASPGVLGMLAAAWERQPRTDVVRAQPSYLIAARVATSSVSRAGLRGLAAGDALLFDRVAPDGGIVICLAEHLAAVGQIAEDGSVTVGAPFDANSPFMLGEFQMSDNDFETDGGAAALDDASISSLPVRLVFELGRREVTLDELRDMAVGSPIPLEKPASSVVDILANGRRIGAGEMVLIGDQLGVRITRLNGHA